MHIVPAKLASVWLMGSGMSMAMEAVMLVLSRKLGEKIMINDNICITVVDIDQGKIRLGIEAPRDIPIFRKELLKGKSGAPEEQEGVKK